jgi:hypothetical protein
VWELCSERLKDNYMVNGKVTYVLDYLRPEDGNYMILESYTNTPHKTIHVLLSDKNNNPDNCDVEYWVGRANEAAVRITDISVSRLHAMLTYSNGQFYVKDELAKFGTLLLLREPVAIPFKKWSLSLQLGRFSVTITWPKEKNGIADFASDLGSQYLSTYDEDAPFLPPSLISALEQDSVRLGLKPSAAHFDDLTKLRNLRLNASKKDDISRQSSHDQDGILDHQNTMREEIDDSHHQILTYQNDLTTINRNRRTDLDLLDNTLEMANESARDLPLGYNQQIDYQASDRVGNTDNSMVGGGGGMTLPQMQTEFGIVSHREGTNNTPMNTTHMGDRSISVNRHDTDRSGSRLSMSSKF